MTLKTNSFEGQSSGTTWSTANSGGGSGTAFNAVVTAGTHTAVFDSAQSMHGANSLHVTASASSQFIPRWTGLSGSSLAVRFYLRLVSSSAAQDIGQFRNSSQAAVIALSASNQLQIKNASGTSVKTFTNALSLNTWYRIEVQVTKGTTTSNGTIAAQYYLGDSTTPVETAYSSGAVNAGTTDLIEFRLGKLTSAPTFEAYFDDAAVSDAGATPLGPATADLALTSPTATASALAVAPSLRRGRVLSSPTATVSTTGPAPTLRRGRVTAAPVATGAASGKIPSTRRARRLQVPAATTGGHSPAPVIRKAVAVPRATVSTQAPNPGIRRGRRLQAPVAHASVLGPTPTVVVQGKLVVQSPRATVTASASSPFLRRGRQLAVPVATTRASTAVPTLVQNRRTAAPLAVATTIGQPATLRRGRLTPVPRAVLSVHALTPAVDIREPVVLLSWWDGTTEHDLSLVGIWTGTSLDEEAFIQIL